MTFLIEKQIRDNIGIDSFEKAIVWSACLLLAINYESTTTNSIVSKNSLYIDPSKSLILIEFNIPLNMSLFWRSMCNPNSIKPLSDLTIQYEGAYFNSNFILPLEPNEVNTLEDYFIWSNKKLEEIYLNKNSEKSKNIIVMPNLKYGTIYINTKLNYDPLKYASSNNLMFSVITFDYTTDTNDNNNTLIGNNILIGNNTLIGN